MFDEEFKSRSLGDMRNVGYSLAGIYAYMVKFVLNLAKFPVKIALRDGEPIYEAAQYIIKNNNIFKLDSSDIEKLKQWQKVWLNCTTVLRYFQKDEDAINYFKQMGLTDHFSYVDTGYQGTISKDLYSKKRELQTIFMIARDKNELPGPCSVLAEEDISESILNFRNKYSLIRPNEYVSRWTFQEFKISLCTKIFEFVPAKYQRVENFIEKGAEFVPDLKERHKNRVAEHEAFYHGLKDGVQDLTDLDIGKSGKYMDAFLKNYFVIKDMLNWGTGEGKTQDMAKDMKQIYKCI